MTPVALAAQFARHGARLVVAGDAVALRYPAERPPPAHLVAAAREHKGELRALVVATAAAGRDLREQLAQLTDAPAPAGYSPQAWVDALAGAIAFSDRRLEMALQLGWSPVELFGFHSIAPASRYDCKGLAWMLERGAQVIELTAEAATICTRTGGLMRFYKSQGNTEAVLPWPK